MRPQEAGWAAWHFTGGSCFSLLGWFPPSVSAHFHLLISLWSIDLNFHVTRFMFVPLLLYTAMEPFWKHERHTSEPTCSRLGPRVGGGGTAYTPSGVCRAALRSGRTWGFGLMGATQEIWSGTWQTPARVEEHRRVGWPPERHVTQPHLQGSSARKLVHYNELYGTEILRFWYWTLPARLWDSAGWKAQGLEVRQAWVWLSGRTDKSSKTKRGGPEYGMVPSQPHQLAPLPHWTPATRSLPTRTWPAQLREAFRDPNSLLQCSSSLSLDLILNVI